MRASPWRSRITLALSSVLAAVLMLAALEGVLRLCGLGAADPNRSTLKYQQLYLPVLRPATRADSTEVLRPVDRRLPYQEVLRQKPANALRVFTFGESAVAGLGFSPNVTFARHLRGLLEAACPDRAVEVVNLGIVAISSREVKQLVADAVRGYHPDAVVVYCGNNEFLEVHAKKYAEAHATLATRTADLIRDSNLFRLLGRKKQPEPPSATEQNMSDEELRVTQHQIIQDIDMTPAEITAAIQTYEDNLAEAVAVAQEHGVPVLLMTVATNWEWRGRSDLPEGWLAELVGSSDTGEAALARARGVLDDRLRTALAKERSDLLFRRAVVHEKLGDFDAARADYIAATDEDPHLRRCLSAMNERVRALAQRLGTGLLDTVAVLSAQARHGIVGFAEFYDYVHFTPKGAILVGAAVFDRLREMGLCGSGNTYDSAAYAREQVARVERMTEDAIAVDDWIGFCFARDYIADRDLWKYEKMRKQLDERIAADPNDWRALAYRGNARYFDLDGAAGAAADYRAALEHGGDAAALRANLQKLETRAPAP
jgi:tetratricopeptide (TPR) repeat protein